MNTASTTYGFVPINKVKPEQLKNNKQYMVRFSNGEESGASGRSIKSYTDKIFPITDVMLPVEPFSPLSEEEVKMKAQIFNSDFAPLHRNFGMLCFTKAVEWVTERMEGEAEAAIKWAAENGYQIGKDGLFWEEGDAYGIGTITYSELLAIFREEQKRKKDKS